MPLSIDAALLPVIKGSAVAFAQSEIAAKAAIEGLATALGTAPTYEHWTAVFTQWSADYATERQCSSEAAAKAATRMAARLSDTFGLEKPKATGAKATSKSKSREAEKAEIDALIEAHDGDPESMRSAAADALKDSKPQLAERLLKAAKKAEGDEANAARDALKDRWAAVSERLKEAKKAADEALLARVEAALKEPKAKAKGK